MPQIHDLKQFSTKHEVHMGDFPFISQVEAHFEPIIKAMADFETTNQFGKWAYYADSVFVDSGTSDDPAEEQFKTRVWSVFFAFETEEDAVLFALMFKK